MQLSQVRSNQSLISIQGNSLQSKLVSLNKQLQHSQLFNKISFKPKTIREWLAFNNLLRKERKVKANWIVIRITVMSVSIGRIKSSSMNRKSRNIFMKTSRSLKHFSITNNHPKPNNQANYHLLVTTLNTNLLHLSVKTSIVNIMEVTWLLSIILIQVKPMWTRVPLKNLENNLNQTNLRNRKVHWL